MNLPDGFSVFDDRNALALAGLRIENALLGLLVAIDLQQSDTLPPIYLKAAKSTTEAVDSVVNGTPVTINQIFELVDEAHPHLGATRNRVYESLRILVRNNKLIQVGERAGVMFTRAAAVLCLCLLSGCRTPEFSQSVAQPSRKINWYADVDWLLSESPGVKTYHVEYGLHVNTMTNELVTATNRCRVYGLELGRTYYFSVRASDGKSYSLRTDIATFKTP